ncbi:site-specific integrase [Roseibium porphyridii]|uniref:Site-specific integrase n=1 Tax=Roseibium porphyridii TaxID=2866279 RepID=A0ABY8F323_9HYPH|nr:site-specific integrase [Roseibium sp. KMA01]WFE89893.1 site-specific integrase [Roseibium sp. KMA01]
MPKLTKRIVDQAKMSKADYFIWDDDLQGFGLRVFTSGRRSYVVQYRAKGRTRRFTIGPHGVWTPETARKEARVLLGRVAQGENPAEERELDHKAISVKELCQRYLEDAKAGLILGKKRRPKKESTIYTDEGRIKRHIVPLLGSRRVKDLTSADITRFMRDVASGRTKMTEKTRKHGKTIVRGGVGTGTRTLGLLGAILTYARENGIIDTNPAHGIRKVADQKLNRRLSEDEYRLLGRLLSDADQDAQLSTAAAMVRALALTGCRRGEIINLDWREFDAANSCFWLRDSKEGASVRPIGLPIVELLEARHGDAIAGAVFEGTVEGKPFIGFPKHWRKILRDSPLADITPHVLRHSFASIANDLGFTESTIAALLGHAQGTITSRYIHSVDTALIMAADTIAGYIQGLLDGVQFTRTTYAMDRHARAAAMNRILAERLDGGQEHSFKVS